MNRAQATILYRAKIRIVIAGFGALHMARGIDDMKEIKIERPPRINLSAKESLKRTSEFDKRKEQFVATVRKGKS